MVLIVATSIGQGRGYPLRQYVALHRTETDSRIGPALGVSVVRLGNGYRSCERRTGKSAT